MEGYKPITYNWFEQPKKKKKDMTFPEAQMKFNLSSHGDVDRDGRPNWRDCRPYDLSRQGVFGDIATGIKERISHKKDKQTTLDDFQDDEKHVKVLPDDKEDGNEEDSISAVIGRKTRDWQEKKAAKKRYKVTVKEGGAAELAALPYYLLVQPRNEKWQLWGPYNKEQIDEEYNTARSTPGIVHVEKTHNPAEVKTKNAELRGETFKKRYDTTVGGLEKRGLTLDQISRKAGDVAEEAFDVGPRGREMMHRIAQGSSGPPALGIDRETGQSSWFKIKAGPGTTRGTRPPRRIPSNIGYMSSPMLSTQPQARQLGFGMPKQQERERFGDIDMQPRQEMYEDEPQFMERQPIRRSRGVWTPGQKGFEHVPPGSGYREKSFRVFTPFKPVKAKFKFVGSQRRIRRKDLL